MKENELLQAVLNARQRVDETDAALSEAKKSKESAEMALIEYMDDHELKQFRSSAFNCLVIRKEPLFASILPDKKEEAMRWIEEDCGRKDLIKPAIHNKTLTSFLSERLKIGEPVPQSMFSYFYKPTLTINMGQKEG